ncbi:MAG: PcfJ domain-containing protein [Myxococcales bacterium]|nr:PcfJ domain-containing protein [Myxococcales bacterium]
MRARSDLLAAAPTVARGAPRFEHVDALIHLARWWREHRAPVAAWPGRRGHPLVIVDDLARHVLGLYPTPRFLARAWFADDRDDADAWRGWVIAHGRGTALRRLPLPIALTRAMEHHFLATPDHLPVRFALRCAEVRALGGSLGLGYAVAMSRLGRTFTDGAYWRAALAWIVRWEDEVPPDHLGPVLDYLDAARAWTARPPVVGRTATSLWRHVVAWHTALGKGEAGGARWPPAGWAGHVEREALGDGRTLCWDVIELTDAGALAFEGNAMRHCVFSYQAWCRSGASSIWSLRRRVERGDDYGQARAVLTIEVAPRTRTIVQVRGLANRVARGEPLAVVERWAQAQGLGWAPDALGTRPAVPAAP